MTETAESQQRAALQPIETGALRPALLAAYRDLTALRYDFPIVLVEGAADGTFARSLTSVVDDVLRELAPRGIEGEELRRRAIGAERDIRALVTRGERGLLADLWERAAPELANVGARFAVDGELADCDGELPRRLIEHAWRTVQRAKAERFHTEVNRLVQALSDVLRAAFVRSEAGRRPETLQAAFGRPHHEQFDFETMSRLLARGTPDDELSPVWRERIEWALGVLRRQRFYDPSPRAELAQAFEPPFEYCFGSCADAVAAFRARLPEVVEFVKALSIAELEADGRYVPSEHDAFFAAFGESSLGREDLELFPDYLVCVGADESAAAMELLSSDVPVKVLVETDELLDAGHLAIGLRNVQLAPTAIGLHDVFVLQTTSSSLYQLRDRVLGALRYAGAALVSVFSGSSTPSGDLHPYLTAAAALEARAFPAFAYDPAAGSDLASRFSLEGNPQPELDWPLAMLEYADSSQQRVSEPVAFTVADFALCDRRYAQHFARVPRESPGGGTVSVGEWLSLAPADAEGRVPQVIAVDENDSLQSLVVDTKLAQAARRCLELWRGYQELARLGVPAAVEAADEPVVEVADVPAEAPEEIAEEPERASDDAWIETARCSTCNECTAINNRMFEYNENKQAYIKDPNAGTFRELVEAAEVCQVAVIHPGKPRNPNEPGLDELVERARPFQ